MSALSPHRFGATVSRAAWLEPRAPAALAAAHGVIRGDTVLWAEAFGWADREARVPATLDTAYGLASVGKSVTATAIMTLVEQGKVRLDDRADALVGHLLAIREGPPAGPTVRQLLDMTAGIPHGALSYTTAPASEDRVLRDRALVVFPPGEVFHYSNFSIAVADRVIETVAARPFDEYLAAAVFQPLRMTHAFVSTNASGSPGVAARYGDDGARFPAITRFPRSSRGIHASLADLLAYAAFQLDRPQSGQARILSGASLTTMHDARSAVPGAFMALGWGSLDLPDGTRWLLSDGQDQGVQATVSLVPSAGMAVVCLTNVTGDQADDVAIRVTDRLVLGFAARAAAVAAAIGGAEVAFTPSGDWLGEWRGGIATAAGAAPITLTFTAAGVAVAIGDRAASPLADPRFGRGLLGGSFRAVLPLEERPAGEHRVELGLHRDGDRLYGFAFANFQNERGHFELPAYVSLRRTPVP